MMNKNQSSKYGLAAYALVIPLILVCMVFSFAFAQENSSKADATKKGIIIKQKVADVPSKALIILDGKIIDKAKMDAINPKDINSVNVLKGKDAKSIYGRQGKNGVVLITLKKEDSGKKSDLTWQIKDSTGTMRDVKPLIVIDGVPVDNDALKDLQPDHIKSFSILKDEKATSIYGEKGKDGVILVITKKDVDTTLHYTYKGYVILLDGKEIDVVKLNSMKPNEIGTMQLLEGEKATALYGKKAENGVVLVTTKKI